jgi:hypothetical protein
MSAEMHGSHQNPLADFEPADVLAYFDHIAGNIAAENVRELHAGQSFAHPHIQMIQRAGTDTNHHLILARLRFRNIFIGQNFRTTELMNAHRFHKTS